MYAQHYTLVNQVNPPKRRSRTRQRLRSSTNYCLAIIKPLLSLKERIINQILGNTNTNVPTRKEAGTTVTVVDITQGESPGEPGSEIEAQVPSLDRRRSKLPLEVRLQIWRLCWVPRLVEVHHYVHDRVLDDRRRFDSNTFRSASRPPATLQVCRESRIETLKHYSLAFAARSNALPEVYFNFNLDRLYIKEADMLTNSPLTSMFLVRDVRRVQVLALPDCYIQQLMRERQIAPELSLAFLLFRTSFSDLRGPYFWESLREIDIVIDVSRQRDDRVNSWVTESYFICAHCVIDHLKQSISYWPNGPKISVEGYNYPFEHIEIDPQPPALKPIIKQRSHFVYKACCRLRSAELLTSLRRLENPPKKPKWLLLIFGSQLWTCQNCMPCRCRLESFILSQGLGLYDSVYNGSSTCCDVGELGGLCKKWLNHTRFLP